MWIVDLLLVILALAGHAGLWVTAINRCHATAASYLVRRSSNVLGLGGLGLVPLLYAWWAWRHGSTAVWGAGAAAFPLWAQGYFWLCVLNGAGPVVWHFVRKWRERAPAALRVHHRQRLKMVDRLGAPPVGRGLRRFITQLPGNECFDLELTEKHVLIDRLPRELDGFSIVHLSDLHFCQAIDRRYFEEVMALANQMRPDLVAVTGDLVDDPDCIDWIPDTLGKLRAPYGVWTILGNHDSWLKQHLGRLRATLTGCGLNDLGGTWRQIEVEEVPVVIAGNELPWLVPAADLKDAPRRNDAGLPLRILLAHSPDQLPWARVRDFDLMMAGHTHGGQIRLPVLGPIFSPSHFGVRYACGTFHEHPTVMHVSRGLSGLDPVRFNCCPEVTKLVLRSRVARDERSDPQARELAQV